MFPIFIHIENHKLCLWKKRAVALKQQMPCVAAALPVKKEFRRIRRFSGILI